MKRYSNTMPIKEINKLSHDDRSSNTFKLNYTGLLTILFLVSLSITSCNKFLDIVPDNVATLDNAFTLRQEAKKYLFGCYSYLPRDGDGWFNLGMMAGDEIWVQQTQQTYWNPAFFIAQGQQTKSSPYLDVWKGLWNGATGANKRLFSGIRDCNVFIENLNDLNKVPDISLSERKQWIGEAEFLKAYYHYYLLRMYGPIPIIDKNTAIDSDIAGTYTKRMPVDYCVNYISALLDSAAENLPPYISNEPQELGRITQPIALAVKAKLWLLAASPLFNGNPDYAGFTDKEGTALFNSAYDVTKWEKARDAAKAAIVSAEAAGNMLYQYKNDPFGLNDTTKIQLSIRQAVCERWNPEHVWANSNSYFSNSSLCMILLERSTGVDRLRTPGVWAAPLKIAKMFYTSHGVPIDEDKTLDFSDIEKLRTSVKVERFNIEPGYQTARLNFDREPRFYADLGFDGGVWYKKDSPSRNDINTFYAKTKFSDKGGAPATLNWNESGYYIKKLVNWEQVFSATDGSASYLQYPWPEIRLADLYLIYAEALNEAEPASPMALTYLDKIRARAGLKGVAESWSNFSTNPAKYTSQDGLREIIHRERLIELAFEGHRFWDLRRWKEAAVELNKDITGWSYTEKTAALYYKEKLIYNQTFITPRDYLWPIGDYDTRRNPKLVENPGW